MQINTNNNYNTKPLFKANLELSGENSIEYIGEHKLTKMQIKTLKYKFAKKTEDIPGTLILDFGHPYNSFDPACIAYIEGEDHYDSMPVEIHKENLSIDNEFVDKLVKILNIFQMRERNLQKIGGLLTQASEIVARASEIAKSSKSSSLGAAETIFKMRDWRNHGSYDHGLTRSILSEDDTEKMVQNIQKLGFTYSDNVSERPHIDL